MTHKVTPQPRPTMSLLEASAFLGVSHDTLWEWIDLGQLQPRKNRRGNLALDTQDVALLARRRFEADHPDDATPIQSAAGLLGITEDAVRTLIDKGVPGISRSANGVITLDPERLRQSQSETQAPLASTPNRLPGVVTDIANDEHNTWVEVQCGPHRVVSLMSNENFAHLGLEIGSRTVASIQSMLVKLDRPGESVR